MAARNSKGVEIFMTAATAAATDITPTGITSASPAVVSSADTVANGDVIYVPAGATGMPSLDGNYFVVANANAGSDFELLGSDATGDTYAAGTTPELKAYDDTDMVKLCLSSMTFNPEQASTVSAGTYCDPSQSVPGLVAGAGTVDIAGYVDITDADYAALIAAEADGNSRTFRIMLPSNGYVIFPGVISSLNLDIPIDGAIAWSAQVALGSKPKHLF